jgi:RimJ/RimL family protein N-acetyltransferase
MAGTEQLTESLAKIELSDGRVLLRPPTLADVPAVTAACQDPAIARWTTVPSPYASSDAVFFVEQVSDQGWAAGTTATFVITDPVGGALLGSCGLGSIDRTHGRGEIGYWTTADARGRGVATSAVRLVCGWAFEDPGGPRLARVDWRAFGGNEGSWRVAERCGFTMEGKQRSSFCHRGTREDEWLGGLLAGEQRSAGAPRPPG